jgi:hypothetical protein
MHVKQDFLDRIFLITAQSKPTKEKKQGKYVRLKGGNVATLMITEHLHCMQCL